MLLFILSLSVPKIFSMMYTYYFNKVKHIVKCYYFEICQGFIISIRKCNEPLLISFNNGQLMANLVLPNPHLFILHIILKQTVQIILFHS